MKIALISDTHLADRAGAFADNLRATLTDVGQERCDLVIHLGDVTADAIRDPAEFGQASRLLAGLAAPVLYVPGNHDIGDNPPAPGDAGSTAGETPFSRARLEQYRANFGPDWWAVDAAGWRLIGLDAQLFGAGVAEEEAQFSWAAGEAAAAAGPIALFLHKPLFLNNPSDTPVHPRYVPAVQRQRLLDLFVGRDLRLIVSGHVHQRRRVLIDGIEHVWLPSVAFSIPDQMQERIGEKQVGHGVLELTPDAHSFRFVTAAGVINHSLADVPDVYPELRLRPKT